MRGVGFLGKNGTIDRILLWGEGEATKRRKMDWGL